MGRDGEGSKGLQSAPKAANVSVSRQALATPQKVQQNSSQTGNTRSASSQNLQPLTASPASPSALGLGNLPAAQQAFASLRQTAKDPDEEETEENQGGSVNRTAPPPQGPVSSGATSQTVGHLLDVLA